MRIEITSDESDSTGISPQAASFFKMNGFFFEFGGKKINRKKLVSKLEASVSEIDQRGVINLIFNSKLLIPESFDPLIELEAIKFTLKKSNGTSLPIISSKN